MPNPQRLTRKAEVRQQGTLNPWPRDVTHPLFQDSDFFAPRDLLQVKCEMLRQVRTENQAISQAALAFGFSRPPFIRRKRASIKEACRGYCRRSEAPGHPQVDGRSDEVSGPSAGRRTVVANPIVSRGALRCTVHPRTIERWLRRQGKKLRRRSSFPRRRGRASKAVVEGYEELRKQPLGTGGQESGRVPSPFSPWHMAHW